MGSGLPEQVSATDELNARPTSPHVVRRHAISSSPPWPTETMRYRKAMGNWTLFSDVKQAVELVNGAQGMPEVSPAHCKRSISRIRSFSVDHAAGDRGNLKTLIRRGCVLEDEAGMTEAGC